MPDTSEEPSASGCRQVPGSQRGFPTSTSGRQLLTSQGNAWFGVGDAPWSLIGALTLEEITTYLEERAAQGFRMVMFSAPEWHYASNAPNNAYGAAAFTGTPFQSPLNDDYWRVVDHAVSESQRLGITTVVSPAYWGCCSDGVQTVLAEATDSDVYAYGLAIGTRYKDYPNIMWLAGHDLYPPETMKSRYSALQRGIHAAGDLHLWIPGGHHNSTGTTDWSGADMEWDVESVFDYTFQPIRAVEDGYVASTLPVIHLEGSYENERTGDRSGATSSWELRYQAWGAFVGGAAGHIYGNDPMWDFNTFSTESEWTAHVEDPGAISMTHLAQLMAACDWGGTEPDMTGSFLTGGGGLGGWDRAGARFGGSLALVYLPTPRVATLDLTALTGTTFRITRIDPSSGATSLLASRVSGADVVVDSQGLNSAGDSDWALLIEGAAGDRQGPSL